LLYDAHKGQWTPVFSGGYLETPAWSADSSFLYFQDQLEEQESVFRANVKTLQVNRVAGFADVLRGNAVHCTFAGLGQEGSLYATIERGSTDIYALDLDLP
jgi:hypothetical protein